MRIPLAVLADYANLSADGKLNIMGIFDIIFASRVPALHPQMQLVLKLQSEPAERGTEKKLDVRLIDEDGKKLVGLESSFRVPDDFPLTGEIPQIISLGGLRFERFGEYAFHVLVNGDTKAHVPFCVKQFPSQPRSA